MALAFVLLLAVWEATLKTPPEVPPAGISQQDCVVQMDRMYPSNKARNIAQCMGISSLNK